MHSQENKAQERGRQRESGLKEGIIAAWWCKTLKERVVGKTRADSKNTTIFASNASCNDPLLTNHLKSAYIFYITLGIV